MNSELPGISDVYPKYGFRGFWSGIKAFQIILVFSCCMLGGVVRGQTDFAPGEIMFTGYDSDIPDAFSFVLLKDVAAGTVIYITDWGWTNSSGFRIDNTFEGTIELTFNAAYPCGTEVLFTDSEDANDWDNPVNQSGTVVGTVVIIGTGGVNGPELGTTGDQLFIYQSPQPTSTNQESFVTAISMDLVSIGGVIYPWNTSATSDDNSAKPDGLEDFEVVAFGGITEFDNAKYDCSPNVGTADYLQSVITNENSAGILKATGVDNWNQSDSYITLSTYCNFCCLSTTLSGPDVVSTNETFTININGNLPAGESWELYTTGCGVGSPVQTTMGSSFTITAPGTEGNINYYIKASNSTECAGQCVFISICVENTPVATCTSCTANPETCGDCLMPDVDDNPDLDSGCYAIKLIFILDESGSIGSNEPDVKAGVLAFLNAINGQDMQVALIEFSDLGRLVNGYTQVNNGYIDLIEGYFDNVAYNGQWYQPGGGTNWHDAMIKADALDPADIIIFFTDGVPTGWTNNSVVDYCSSGQTTQTPEIVNPVKLANKFKSEDTHMFMLGVGSGIDAYNLQLMSGAIEYEPGVNNIGTADYSIGNFADLAEDLEAFVNELCETPLDFDKQLLGTVCDGIQQFMFIIHNPGEESAATIIEVIDSFPSGYTNLMHTYPSLVKICYGAQCAEQGEMFPVPNGFIWTTTALAPGDSDTLIISAEVVPGGEYTNIGWAQGENTDLVSDTVIGSQLADDLPPIVSCPANVTIECSESSLPANTGTATGTDPDGSTPAITYSDQITPGSCDGEFTINRTWIATDGCNNTDTCIQVIFAEDTTSPVIDCAPDITIQCSDSTLPATTGTTDVDDNCDNMPMLTYDDVTMEETCGSTIERTWLAEDDCGNTSTCIQTITIDDTTLPVITCPADVTIACTDNSLPAYTGGSATATDNCDPNPVISYSDVVSPGDCQEGQVITRTWSALDECGNLSTCNQIIFVIDNSPPAITCPANVTIECTASTLPSSTGSPTTTDNCSTLPDITYTNQITNGSCSQEYTITRTWTAADGCGNSSSCVQTISVDDSTPPVLSCPANITIACTANTLPANTGNATASDNCDLATLITYSDVTIGGSCPQEYTITRTWIATDDCGNTSTCNQTIFIDDNMSPALTCPANITIDCTANTLPGNTGIATSTDNCDNSPAVTFSDVTVGGGCPQEYTIMRTWLSTDDCGNTGTCVQTIFIDDSNPPLITCPPNVTIQCTAVTLPSNTGTATGTDNCDVSPVLTYTDVTVSGACPQEYTITRTWYATDDCGNSSTCNQIIFIDDSVGPIITCPANITIECTANTLPVNTGTATGTDNCDLSPLISYSDATSNGGCPQEYTITRTWAATDDCGNSNTCVQIITINDSTSPNLTCPPNITIECTASTLPANTGNATTTDNCDLTPVLSYSDVNTGGSCNQEYTITRTWTSTDDCGNSTNCIQTIFVEDSTSPVITCPADITIQCTASTLPANTGSATATDNCDLTPVMIHADVTVAGTCPQEYTITRTWTSTDACGNSSTCNQLITIEDTTSPTITCPADITIECIENTLPDSTGTPGIVDSCDPSPEFVYNDITVSGPAPNGHTIQRTWTATDSCGNSASCLQVITVENPLNPEMIGLPFDTICSGQSVTFEADSQGLGETYQWVFGSGSTPSSASGVGPHGVSYTYDATNGSVGASVLLTVSIAGCASVTDTVSNIHVNAIPNPAINASTANLCYFKNRTFKPVANEMPGYTYEWDFGSGASLPPTSGYGPHVVSYSTTGPKTVRLIVFSNEAGASCGDTATITFNVVSCPGNITGRVKTLSGAGIGGVTIRLFNDTNYDGISDGGSPVRTVTTTATGSYSMVSLTPGQYVIVETQPANHYSLSDGDESNDNDIPVTNNNPNDDVIPVTMEPQEIDADNNFIEATSPGIINGYVFEDFDNDGVPDGAEGISNVTIHLHPDVDQNGAADAGPPLATVTTSGVGFFTFGEVANGDYVIVEEQPTGYNNEQDYDATNDEDVVPNTNQTDDIIPVTIANSETDSHNFFKESNICSHVVASVNDNGPGTLRYILNCVDSGDTITFHPGLAGAVIHLTSDRIVIDKNIYIHSTLSPRVRIHSDIGGAFKINSGFTAEFKNLNFTSGLSGFPGAAFENYGHLVLWDAQILKNLLLLPGNYLIYNGTSGMVTTKGIIQIEFD